MITIPSSIGSGLIDSAPVAGTDGTLSLWAHVVVAPRSRVLAAFRRCATATPWQGLGGALQPGHRAARLDGRLGVGDHRGRTPVGRCCRPPSRRRIRSRRDRAVVVGFRFVALFDELDDRKLGGVVDPHDRDLAGQFGDGDRVAVTAPTPATRRRPPAASRSFRSWPAVRPPRWAESPRCCLVQSSSVASRSVADPSTRSNSVPPLPASPTDVSTKAVPSASLSSLRRIRPSRSAHGQMSTVSIDSARMLASATSAPATICGARSALTPSNSARSAVVILEMKAMSCLSPLAVSVRFTLAARRPTARHR